MKDWLSAAATSRPGGAAVILPNGDTVTYAELQQMCVLQSASLAESGVQRGNYVALLMENGLSYMVMVHAIMRLGAVLIPLNIRLGLEELAYQLSAANVRFLCFDEHLRPAAEGLQNPGIKSIYIGTMPEVVPEGLLYTSGIIDLDAVCAIVFTSGTSGKPRGAQLTYGNFLYSAMASAYRLGVLPEDRWLICLPMFHVGGLSIIIRSCLYNTAVVLYDASFDALRIVIQQKRDHVTLLSVVPTQLYRLLQIDDGSLSNLRLILLGGAATTSNLLAQAKQHHLNIATTYGLTESTSQVATALPELAYEKPGSVGRPLPFTSVRIVDGAGHELSAGEIGEVVVSGPTLMRGYLGQHELEQNGWFSTGDIGYLDSDGDLWIMQRRSDLIISGGENVYPAEVENAIRQHPDVADVVVIGLPDAEWGQQVAAAVILREGSSPSAELLSTFCVGRLARYKCPRIFKFVSYFSLTASGKVNRQAIATLFET